MTTPDRTDAIARLLDDAHAVGWLTSRDTADAILTTDDPAALAATLWERHADAVLTAGVDAGALHVERSTVPGSFLRRLVTTWRKA